MIPYEIVPTCLRDIAALLAYKRANDGRDAAVELEDHLFAAFDKLSEFPGIGHRRPDLTSRPFYFHAADPYLIVHARGFDPMPILGVIHSSRDLKKLLSTRRFR